jgi:hypothetical protein
MFDQPDKSTQLLLYTDTKLIQSNVTYSAGFSEQIMDGVSFTASLTGSTDYEWYEKGPEIRPVDGGELDGAPVAYASYDFKSTGLGVFLGFLDTIELAAIVPLLLMMSLAVFALRKLEGYA